MVPIIGVSLELSLSDYPWEAPFFHLQAEPWADSLGGQWFISCYERRDWRKQSHSINLSFTLWYVTCLQLTESLQRVRINILM